MSDGKTMITVCNACLMACCWQGEFMCADAKGAGTVEKTIGELVALDREHPEFWDIDPNEGVSHRVVRSRQRASSVTWRANRDAMDPWDALAGGRKQ